MRFDDATTAREIDARLREVAAVRVRKDDVVGFCPNTAKQSGI